jgi:MSHA biogenesis protein MshL
VSNVTPKILSVTANGQLNSLPLAYSEVREADSVVKATSGQIIVIGGLMQMTRAMQTYGVPGLSSIPLVGNLFKSQQKIKVRSELVILLRPIVIDGDGQWAKVVGEDIDHAAALDPKIRGPIAQ